MTLLPSSLQAENAPWQIEPRQPQLRSFRHCSGTSTQCAGPDPSPVGCMHTVVAGSQAAQLSTLEHSDAGTHDPQQPSCPEAIWPGEQFGGTLAHSIAVSQS
jgi:hypothetical protein